MTDVTRHMHRHARHALVAVALGALGTLAACGGGGTPAASSQPASSSTAGASVTTAQTSAGTVLAGPSGNTMYVLLGSSGSPVACTGGCLAAWPPVMLQGSPQAGSGVTAALGSSNGQLTVGGDPVYYYSGDSAAGQANGQGIRSFGGTWHALQASGQPLQQGGAGAASPSSGPGY